MNLRWHWNVSFGFCIVGHCHGYRQTDRQQQISQMHAMQLILLSVNSNQFLQPNRMRFKSHRYDWHIIQFERAKKNIMLAPLEKVKLFCMMAIVCLPLSGKLRLVDETTATSNANTIIQRAMMLNRNQFKYPYRYLWCCHTINTGRRKSWVTVFFSSSSSMLAHKQRREFCDNNKNAVFSVAQEAKRRRDKCLVRSHGTHSAQIHLHCL